MSNILPSPRPGSAGADLPTQRQRLIARLEALIHKPLATTAAQRVYSPEHDPALRRRSEAVEMLGRFPDQAAAQALGRLVLRGEQTLPFPTGRWLRDTALLTLLQSNRLPRKDVDGILTKVYRRCLLPGRWARAYAELPLLAYYHRQGIFFRAFLLWPLLIFAVPTLIFLTPVLSGPYVGGSLDPLYILSILVIVLGTGMEIYLVHQATIALVAARHGPLLRVPGGLNLRWKAGLYAGLVVAMLGSLSGILVSGCSLSERSSCAGWLQVLLGFWPLLLPLIFVLAGDLELAVRYAVRRRSWRTRLATVVLRGTTGFFYILVLPALAGASLWGPGYSVILLIYMVYLFSVPLLVAGGLRVLTRVLARLARS